MDSYPFRLQEKPKSAIFEKKLGYFSHLYPEWTISSKICKSDCEWGITWSRLSFFHQGRNFKQKQPFLRRKLPKMADIHPEKSLQQP